MEKLTAETSCCGKCAVVFYAKTIREWHETEMGIALDLAQTGKAAGYGSGKPVE